MLLTCNGYNLVSKISIMQLLKLNDLSPVDITTLNNRIQDLSRSYFSYEKIACICPIVNQIWFLTLPNSLSLLFCIFINTTSYHWADTSLRVQLAGALPGLAVYQLRLTTNRSMLSEPITKIKTFHSVNHLDRQTAMRGVFFLQQIWHGEMGKST